MVRIFKAAALSLALGLSGWMFGCDAQSGNSGVRSTYGNIEVHDQWVKRPEPAPRPAQMAPAPMHHAQPAAPMPAAAGNCIYLPTGDRATSALQLCCQMPREVVAGQNFTYTIEVCNLTGMSLSNVNVSYTLDGAKMVSSDPSMGNGGFPVGDLPPHGCKTIKVTASATSVGQVKSCMGATWMNSVCCVTNVVQPALKLTKDVNPKETTPCGMVTYTLTVTNTGTGVASNVQIMDDLPAGLTSDGKSNLSWNVGTLGAGQSQTRTFAAKPGKTGSYVNHGRASADNGLTATSNDVSIMIKAPSLTITKTCPTKVYLGRPSQFKIVVSNKGDAPATNTRVEDMLPGGLVFSNASDGGVGSGGRVTWNLGTLAAGASKELTVNCSGGGLGKVDNKATAMADCAEAVSATCSVMFEGVPDIGTSIIDDTGVVPLGNEHVFHYRVRNQGQIDLTNVKMVAALDSGLDFKRSTFAGANAAGSNVTFSIGTLRVGQEIMLDIICTGSKTGELVVRTTTSADNVKDVRNDEQVNYVER